MNYFEIFVANCCFLCYKINKKLSNWWKNWKFASIQQILRASQENSFPDSSEIYFQTSSISRPLCFCHIFYLTGSLFWPSVTFDDLAERTGYSVLSGRNCPGHFQTWEDEEPETSSRTGACSVFGDEEFLPGLQLYPQKVEPWASPALAGRFRFLGECCGRLVGEHSKELCWGPELHCFPLCSCYSDSCALSHLSQNSPLVQAGTFRT